MVEPSFLTPGTSVQAQEIRDALDLAGEKLERPIGNRRKGRWRLRMKGLAQEIRSFLDQRGSDKGVLVALMNEGEDVQDDREQ